jgi:hypothetical protein
MPDIQTALKTALKTTLQEWDDDEGTNVPVPSSKQPVSLSSVPTQGIPMAKTFNVTNNISRVSFQYIKDNPGSTRKEIITALEHQGFNSGSTSSLIAQMRRNKMIHETNGLHYADIDEYRPLKSLKAIKKMEGEPTPKRKYEKKSEGIAALRADPAPTLEIPVQRSFLTKLVRTQSPDDIIKNLSVFQARELYDRLKQIFNA